MKFSQLLLPTLRDVPAEAEVISHQLLIRAGYIRRLAGGIYTLMPLLWRVIYKLETIVRDEMNRAGAQELLMPIMQPADIWQTSGRWEVYGKELIRFKDRHDRDCVLGPTHEEVITTLAKNELRSYRQLPMNLYQIQNKYRDEIRPRFGLLRAREFIMKDAYSFHSSQADLEREYEVMAQAYKNIFKRCGLETRMVQSDSGAIGGKVSHEFMVLTRPTDGGQESGENEVFYCEASDYAANGNHATSILPPANTTGHYETCEIIDTPAATTIEVMHQQFGMRPEIILKALLIIADEKTPVMALIRGDQELEETKFMNAIGANEIRMATEDEVRTLSGGSSKGFIGPVNFPTQLRVVADESVRDLKKFAVAVNQVDKHMVGANWGEHVPMPTEWAEFRKARVGDGSPDGKGPLKMARGIEVGNIFQLGTKYSTAMGATYAAEDGTEQPFIMGCYGLGITRTAAAAIERYHDANGIIWPMALAPYQVVVVPVNTQDETQMALAQQAYDQLLAAGVEVVMDDRDERAGVKFKDADLIGFPIRLTAGKKAAEGLLECKLRDQPQAQELSLAQAIDWAKAQVATWQPTLTH
jgi:prolyl-tRNA synthetase